VALTGDSVVGKTVPMRGPGRQSSGRRDGGGVARRAVILAGGQGSRLRPYTAVLPKPLMPVGDRAILDIVLRQLRAAGFADVTLAVGHLAHLIRAVFGDGSECGVPIRYHHEDRALGTAGPLATIDGLDETFLMMNGDVLTTLDYAALVDCHVEARNVLTVATHRRVVQADYGVLNTAGRAGPTDRVIGYEEKPELLYTVSMGVYVLEPRAVEYVPDGEAFDLPDLVLALLAAGEPVGSYLFDGYWLDIGRREDYERAIADYERLAPLLLPEGEGVLS
jgi:NDP-sugar pyrophosphorylase family protein